MSRPPVFDQEAAEVLALRALAYLAGDEIWLAGFIKLTGIDVAELRVRAAEPVFLGAVLDFLLANETLLVAFAAAAEAPPEAVAAARRRLPGRAVDSV
jgi:Protein of unknown function (DUF3572)